MEKIDNTKIVTSNISGNVGKSEACRHLIAPRITDAELISIESINSNGSGVAMEAEQFSEIMRTVMMSDSAVVDVGSADFKEFMTRMVQQAGSHEDIDFFVLPVVADKKQQTDTVKTIQLLRAMGVEPEKIRILFNKVRPTDHLERVFDIVCAHSDDCVINFDAKIELSPYFEKFKVSGLTVEQLNNDDEDYRAKMKAEKNPETKEVYYAMWELKGLHKTAVQNLDRAFSALIA